MRETAFLVGFTLRGSSEAGGREKVLQTSVRVTLGVRGVEGHRVVGYERGLV